MTIKAPGNPPFSFSPFLPISFFFSPFLSFFPFFLYEIFLFLSFFFLLFFFSSFLLIFSSFWHFLLPFGSSLTEWSREEASSPFPHATCVVLNFPSFFLNSFISFYCIINHVANYEPHIQVHHMALSMCHSLRVPCGIPLTMPCVI